MKQTLLSVAISAALIGGSSLAMAEEGTVGGSSTGDTQVSHDQSGNTVIELVKETADGEIRVELTIQEGDEEEGTEDDIKVKVYRNGEALADEDAEPEMEEWEEEIIENIENAFLGTPRKGIFALHQDRDGGFLEVGFGLKTSDGQTKMREGFEGLDFNTEVNASLQFSGLFYEYYSESGQNGLFGLNFYNNDFIGMDLIIGKEHDSFAEDKEDTLLLPIDVRKSDITAGLRSAFYLGPLVVQGQVRREVTDHHEGYTASLQTGARLQIRNLNFHGVVGAQYQSEEVVDYYYGVTASEATADFAEYNPGEDLTYNAEVGASYPLSEDWVLRGQVNYTRYSDAIVDSPFWAGDNPEHISSRLMLMLVL